MLEVVYAFGAPAGTFTLFDITIENRANNPLGRSTMKLRNWNTNALETIGTFDVPTADADVSLTEFYRAAEVFCTGTMGEIAAVTTIDGRTIGDGTIGPVTKHLSALYAARTAGEGTLVV